MPDSTQILFVVFILAVFFAIEFRRAIHAPRRSHLDRWSRHDRPLTKYAIEQLERDMQ